MSRQHKITGQPYEECAVCGTIVRKSATCKQGGLRVCCDCTDKGPYVFPPHHGFTTIRWNDKEFGVCTQIEEFGAYPANTDKEYGVLVALENVKTSPTGGVSSISGEHGTLTWLADFKLPYVRT